MEFYKSRVYTAVNADELMVGSRVILGDSLSELREAVEAEKEAAIQNLMIIHGENMSFRFTGDKYHSGRSLAYLIEPPALPTMAALAGNRGRSNNMTDYDFENITERVITILKIVLLAIVCGIGLLALISGIAVALG